jgi:multiple sugar transport system permease protein
MMIGIVGLALLVHASPGRFGSTMRFVYYIPGALAGIANFVL